MCCLIFFTRPPIWIIVTTYDSLVSLGGYGFCFSYQKEFSFVGSVDYILTIRVDAIIRRIFEVVPKSDCHVTFQKKERKK